MTLDLAALEAHLWAAADQLWANTGLRPADFSEPVLGLIFLRYVDERFAEKLADRARFPYLLRLTDDDNVGKALNEAMSLIESANADLKGILPRGYHRLPNATLLELLRLLAPLDIDGDAFGKVYEYFLGSFARAEGSKGGVFYTPSCIVRLIVEILQPFHGRILDPACGSGGMFVQCADFVQRHQKSATSELTVFGTEKDATTVKLARMNLAVHGLSGDIRVSNTYYEDPHEVLGRFDFVMANPPFNVSGVDKDRLRHDERFALGLPGNDNANYLWIQLFHAALNETGRAGFVMANSAGDARGGELQIRKKIVQSGAVDVIVSIGPNFFYTVTLPCTLWFFDKNKRHGERKNTVLFIDARPYFRQVTRAIRELTHEQLEFLANIARLYRGEKPEFDEPASNRNLLEKFPTAKYVDVPGLCKVATLAEIEAQGWSLNPGRYVGIGERALDDVDFLERLQALHEELELLNRSAGALEKKIRKNAASIVDRTG